MKAELKNGNLVLTIPLNSEFTPSSTGKMLLCSYIPWTDLGVKHMDQPIRATVTVGCKNTEAPSNGKAKPIAGRFGRPEGVTA